jgi:hypothetical protein
MNMSTTLSINPNTNIASLTVMGRISVSDLLVELDKFYAGPSTALALCDLSNADLGLLSSKDLDLLARHTAGRAAARAGGRTAIVAMSDLAFGLSRMYGMLAEYSKHSVAIRVFRGHEEALQWLQEQT